MSGVPTNARPPRVTVYITNYNYGRYLRHAVDSVLRQTLQDFELIIIDDGSTDDSRSIIESYVGHPKITVIFQNNKGLNVTNNIALRRAWGDYIMRLDADDYLDENALAVLSGVLDRHPDVGMVFPDYYMVDATGHVYEVVRRHDFEEVTLLDSPAHGACTLVRRSCLVELGGYDESFRCQDGYDLWLRFTKRFKVKNVNLPLFYYRQHGSNLTRDERRILATRAEIVKRNAGFDAERQRAVAIVPVRGPACDPHCLSMRPLAGRLLLDWTLDTAMASPALSGVIVTSADEEVLAHAAARWGDRVRTVHRDPALALPNTDLVATLLHALEDWAAAGLPAPDVVVQMQIESPLRHARIVEDAINQLVLFGTDSVVSVHPETAEMYWHSGGGLEPLRGPRKLRLERETLYREAGQVFVVRRAVLEQTRRIVAGRVGHLVIDRRSALRIASPEDWSVAEWMLREGRAAGRVAEPLVEG